MLLIHLEDRGMTILEEDFEERFGKERHGPIFKLLLNVIQGLMRFLPSRRITAEKALEFLGNMK